MFMSKKLKSQSPLGLYSSKKKKRAVDPNAPLRPNLLSQAKELRLTKEDLASIQQEIVKLTHMSQRQTDEIFRLRSKLMGAESNISHLQAKLNRK